MDSIKKNTVAATIAIEMIQNEMATGSFGLRKPFKAVSAGGTPAKAVADIVAIFSQMIHNYQETLVNP